MELRFDELEPAPATTRQSREHRFRPQAEMRCEDNLTFLSRIADGAFKLILTSPPYNIGKAYEGRRVLDEYVELQRESTSRYLGERTGALAFDRITVNPAQMDGMPCIRGLRIPAATVVALMADGMTEAEILSAYPDLEREDIRQALYYAAEAMSERKLPLRQA